MIPILRLLSAQVRKRKLTEGCLYATAFLLPLTLNGATLFLLIGILCYLAEQDFWPALPLAPSVLDKGILLFAGLGALSIFQSPDKGFSFYNYWNLMGRYLLIYYFAVSVMINRQQRQKLLTALFAGALLVCIYGLVQYLQGLSVHAAEWVDGDTFPDLTVRIYSTLKNPNLLAGFLLIIISLAAGIGMYQPNRRHKLPYAILLLLSGLCLLLTYSRGIWVSILLVFVWFSLLYKKKLLWLLCLVPFVLFLGNDDIALRMMSILHPEDSSAAIRFGIWENTLGMIAAHPFLGIGWGAYWLTYPAYDFFFQEPSVTIFHAHNLYLHLAAELGIPAFFLFCYIVAGHVALGWKEFSQCAFGEDKGVALGLMGTILGLAVSGFTDYVLYNTQMSMLFWLILALFRGMPRLRS